VSDDCKHAIYSDQIPINGIPSDKLSYETITGQTEMVFWAWFKTHGYLIYLSDWCDTVFSVLTEISETLFMSF
jgi:hypothetical protein